MTTYDRIAELERRVAHLERLLTPAPRPSADDRVMQALCDGKERTAPAIARLCGYALPYTQNVLTTLVRDGRVARPRRGVYQKAGN